jgi:uncharacterized protein
VITRRKMLQGMAALSAGGMSFGGYAVAEPWRLNVSRYRIGTGEAGFPRRPLRIAALADFHVCDPWMSVARVRQIVARCNALKPDVVALLGDYVAGYGLSRYSRHVPAAEWAKALAGLRAPFGVHAVLGNHDWWEDNAAYRGRVALPEAGVALREAGIAVYNNDVRRLGSGDDAFWIAGLGDQWAHGRGVGHGGYKGVDDLAGTLARVGDDAPVVLLAHEPDVFPRVPGRVALTLSGHTHGGQVQFLGYAPVVPSRYGRRYVYGHVTEEGRHLVVSGGLGCSGLPVRFGVPPEIVLVELGGAAVA